MDSTVRDVLKKGVISYLQGRMDEELDDSYEAKPYADRSDDTGGRQGVNGLQVSVRPSMPAVVGRDKYGRPFEWAYTIDAVIPTHARFARRYPDKMDDLASVIQNAVLTLGLDRVNGWFETGVPYGCTFIREADGEYVFGEDFEESYIPFQIGIAEKDDDDEES